MKNLINIFALCILLGCTNQEAQKENKQISIQIEQQLKQINFTTLDLAKVSSKDWSRVCYIPPYALNKYAKKRLGFDWSIEENTDISTNDGISLLVFVKNDEVVEFVQHPRNKGDFGFTCLSRQSAKFAISKTGEWITFVQTNS